MSSRRNFLATTAAAITAAQLNPFIGKATQLDKFKFHLKDTSLQMGVAGYTFLNFTIDQTIDMMHRVGLNAISIKDFHLPLSSSREKIEEVNSKFRSSGITIYAAGVIYMKTKEEVDQAFDYVQKLGVSLIIASPNVEQLPYIEQKVKALNIKVAIHNHGPEDKSYPGPKEIVDRINNMDSRLGICLDIGHAVRAGEDPVKAVSTYARRIFDLHIKDLNGASPKEQSVELGRGIIDIPLLVKALKKIDYQGKCSIEFEKDMKDPLPGLAESVGFFRGVNRSLPG